MKVFICSLIASITIWAIIDELFSFIKKRKYWSFDYWHVWSIVFFSGLIFSYTVIDKKHDMILLAMIMLFFILAFIIPNLMFKSIYRKDKIHNKFRFKSQNFIRPNGNNNYSVMLANKNCIVKLYETEESYIIYYDKIIDREYGTYIGNAADAVKIFEMLAKFFDFDTTVKDIENILRGTNSTIVIKNNNSTNLYLDKTISINNMSIAELIELPGINIGKANKIKKYLQQNCFNTIEEFTNFAQINEEDAKEIQEIFNHDIRYIPKNEKK